VSRPRRRRWPLALALGAAGAIAARRLGTRRGSGAAIRRTTRRARNLELARLGVGVGGTYASVRARQVFASAERRAELDDQLRLRSAEQVAARLGNM
jgi:hypothetical protein